jgi:hypothetical protein
VLARVRLVEDDGADGIAFVQTASELISSTSKKSYRLSAYGLPGDRPNLNVELVSDFLSAFLVRDAWGHMDKLATRIGFAIPSTKDVFFSAAKRRHRAAHSASAQVPLGDLQQFADQAATIAIAYDLLISTAAKSIFGPRYSPTDASFSVKSEDINLLFVDERKPGMWSVTLEGKKRPHFQTLSFGAARNKAVALSKGELRAVIVRDRSLKPSDWYVSA